MPKVGIAVLKLLDMTEFDVGRSLVSFLIKLAASPPAAGLVSEINTSIQFAGNKKPGIMN
jgi:hypothetical protein